MNEAGVRNTQAGNPQKIPDHYIVVFDESVDNVRGRARALAQLAKARIKHEYTSTIHGFSAQMSAQAASALENHPGVLHVEQEQRFRITEIQSGPTWGLDRIDQSALPLNNTFVYGGTGQGVNVYVIDAGIRSTHAEFGSRVVPAFSAIQDGYDADGCNWHGTHVAGTIGGSTYGVAKRATLYSVRVLDCNGEGSTSDVIAGIEWVTANRALPAVANISASGDLSPAINAAVQASIASGVSYSVAAGNDASNACNFSPASAVDALTVGATNWNDAGAPYSNFGACLDLYAPGSGITSASNENDFAFTQANGTSMSAPHVAGAAALYLESHRGATPAQVAQALISNASLRVVSGIAKTQSPNRLLRIVGAGAPLPEMNSPSARFTTACPQNRNNCSFDASTSTGSRPLISYQWSFGDGSSVSSSSPFVRHVFPAKGTYVVTLVVTDTDGMQSSTQSSVTVKSVR